MVQLTLGIHRSQIGLVIDRLLSGDSTKKVLNWTLLWTRKLQIHYFCLCSRLVSHTTCIFNHNRVWMFYRVNCLRTRWLCILTRFLYFLFLGSLSFYLKLGVVSLLVKLGYFSRCPWRCVIRWLKWLLILVSVSKYVCGLGVTIL